jgi:hypothetical protein
MTHFSADWLADFGRGRGGHRRFASRDCAGWRVFPRCSGEQLDWNDFLPLSGALFGILFAIVFLVSGDTPDTDASGADVISHYEDEGKTYVALIVLMIAAIALMFFAGVVRMPKWLTWVSLVLGVLSVAGPLGFIAFLAFPLWVISVGVLLFKRPARVVAGPTGPAAVA